MSFITNTRDLFSWQCNINIFNFKLQYRLIIIICDPGAQNQCQFCEIEIYASSESWINNISIDLWFIYWYCCLLLQIYLD